VVVVLIAGESATVAGRLQTSGVRPGDLHISW